MKKTKLFGWALVALASFSACTNDAEEVLTQESEIKLTSEITPSRVTSLDYQSTQIVEGQQIGVTITGAKSEHKNVAWTLGTDGALTNTDDAVYYSGNNTATITAYHPYNSAWIGTSHAFSVNTDQSDETNYRNSDLLWATASSSKTDKAVGLIFAHKLAKVNVTLTSTDIADLSGATISICGTNIATNFNPSTGELSAATADVQEIEAGVTTEEAYTASAIVVPQTVANGTKFIKVVHGSKTFYYTLAADKELKSGYSHNYTLTVKEKELEVVTESDKITDWTDEDGNIGDANETDVTPYLTFSADEEQTLTMSRAVETLEYSVNNGKWYDLGTTTVTFGGNHGDLRLRGRNSEGTAISKYTNYAVISFEINSKVSCKGDIRTLIDYENYATANTANANFYRLFYNCTTLTTAPELPATNLEASCYQNMFTGCTSLTTAPELPATILAVSCYEGMFYGCTSLTIAPQLPATNLANNCYKDMFYGCASLTTAPKLPATNLAVSCYQSMFYGCVLLTTAPELPATNLVETCYMTMFGACNRLTSITMLATDISASNCLLRWVEYVNSTGTFTKAKTMENLPEGDNGIPNNWTVKNYGE